jgi:amino acid adenylation domain-containing protein
MVRQHGATVVPPVEPDVNELFRDTVGRRPGAPALTGPGTWVTYAELDRRAGVVAARLRAAGVGRGDVVATLLPRSGAFVAAFLAALRVGAAVLPVDVDHPPPFRTWVLGDARPAAVVTETGEPPPGLARSTAAVCTAPDGPVLAPDLHVALTPLDPVYVVYTSGSTGRPKGVVGLHGSLVNRCRWAWSELPFADGELVAYRTSPGFVDAVAELFVPLLAGTPSLVVPGDVAADARRLLALYRREGVTRALFTPTFLNALLDAHPHLTDVLPSLRVCTVSGELVPPSLARRFRRALPAARLVNLYGSSEVAGDATCHDATVPEADRACVPIGRPIANARAEVVGPDLRPLPDGSVGEIAVSGRPLALGYLGRAGLTAERFVPRPDGEAAGERVYLTGDLGRVAPDGLLEYVGRADRQVKVRGCRVELGHVEAALLEHDAVGEAVVSPAGEAPHQRLVAHVVPRPGRPHSPELLIQHVRARLPSYMVPARVVLLAELPRTHSGKLDRRALSEAAGASDPGAGTPARPPDAVEREIGDIWSGVLRAEVGPDDDFFALGGDSLAANEIIVEVTRRFSTEMGLRDLADRPTVRGMAAMVTGRDAARP